jgi:hypothetical protein
MDPITTATVTAIAKILGLSPTNVAKALKDSALKSLEGLHKEGDEAFRKERAKTRQEKRAKILQENLAAPLLDLIYPDSLLLNEGLYRYRFSVANNEIISLALATSKSWVDLTVPLQFPHATYRLIPKPEYPHAPAVSEDEAVKMMANLLAEGRLIFNNPLFRLLGLKLRKTKLQIEFGLTDFAQYVTTHGTLEDELIQALIDADLDSAAAHADQTALMPSRQRFLPDARSLIDLKGRLCSTGICVLLAFMRPAPDNDFIFFVKRRSGEVAAGHGLLSLVPMGYHQPPAEANAAACTSLELSVFREVFEELFGGSEVMQKDSHFVPDWFMRDPRIPQMKWFLDNPGHYVLEMVGLVTSLVLGDYTAAILLAVQNLDYWNRFNSKFAANYEHDDTHNQIVSTKDSEAIAALLRDNTFIDPGRFTLIRGLKRLQKIEPTRVKLPKLIEFTDGKFT